MYRSPGPYIVQAPMCKVETAITLWRSNNRAIILPKHLAAMQPIGSSGQLLGSTLAFTCSANLTNLGPDSFL